MLTPAIAEHRPAQPDSKELRTIHCQGRRGLSPKKTAPGAAHQRPSPFRMLCDYAMLFSAFGLTDFIRTSVQ